MSIFAISDLHLSLSTNKPMDVFGGKWNNYTERIAKNWNSVVTDEDLVLIPGDISWAMYLQEAKADLEYIDKLKGQKLLLRGNHDYWWTTLNKMESFVKENKFSTLHFLKNTAFLWGKTAICGTRGWTIAHSEQSNNDKKIYDRERQRIVLSLENAKHLNAEKIIVSMHFPPIEKNEGSVGFMDIFANYGVCECIFGHLHGEAHLNAPTGIKNGIKLRLVSCDYLNFTPILIEK